MKKISLQLAPNVKDFFVRLLISFAFFILVTGLIGPWVVSSKLLYGFSFYIYGNMGKLLIFSVASFFILAREKLNEVKMPPFKLANLGILACGLTLIPTFFVLANDLLKFGSFAEVPGLAVLTHLVLILATVLPFIAIFGPEFFVDFFKTFKKQVALCIALAIFLYFSIFEVWKLWGYLSDIVLWFADKTMSLFFPIVRVGNDRRILVQEFAVRIDQACSGIEGIYLFSCLYILIGIVDWKRFDHVKYLGMFVPALLGAFIMNVVRVNVLIVIGVLWSPKLALELFHTYAGLLIFVAYFMAFWAVGYKWMVRRVK